MINGILRTSSVRSIATWLVKLLFVLVKIGQLYSLPHTEHFDVRVKATLYESLKVLQ